MTVHTDDSAVRWAISEIIFAVVISPASTGALRYLRSLLRTNMTAYIVSAAEDPRSFAYVFS